MEWNINKLESMLDRITTLLSKEHDIEKRDSLICDQQNLQKMIEYQKPSPIKEQNKTESITDYYCSTTEETMLTLARDNDLNKILLATYTEPFFQKRCKSKKISLKEYLDLVQEFFREFDPRILRTYDDIVKNKKVIFCTRKYEESGYVGECIPIITENTSYLRARYDNTTSTCSVFPHEIAHAYQAKDHLNLEDCKKYGYSIFREAYPKFIEFAFHDFLSRKGYHKTSKSLESELLSEYIGYIEFYYDDLLYIKGSKVENGLFVSGNRKISLSKPRRVYSPLMAMHLISKYREDKQSGIEEADRFTKVLYDKGDTELLNTYTTNQLVLGYKKVLSNIYNK